MTLAELRAAYATALTRLERATDAFQELNADTPDEQRTAVDTEHQEASTEVRGLREQIQRKQDLEEARRNAPITPESDTEERAGGGQARAEVVSEPLTYGRHEPRRSYFLDLARMQIHGDQEARARLVRHRSEMQDENTAREERRQRAFTSGLDELIRTLPGPLRRQMEAFAESGALVERRDLTRTDGAGGEFVPPLWLLDEYAETPRGGRPFVEACRQIPLPAGTDSINVPRIATGTATGVQTADNAAVTETDMTTATVTAPVRTIAGQQDVPLQLLEQSPIAFDEVVFADLIADYWSQCEAQAINGSGAAGQIKGILQATGITAITYTDATPTVPELYPKVADGLSQARTARKRPITHGWIAPRRGYWITAAIDSQNRPLVVPQMQGPNNALGVRDEISSDEDFVLNMLVPHRMSDGVPVNLGAGTNEDRVILTRQSDHLWFEGALRARAMSEVLGGTLQVRLQVYGYVAATFERFPSATSVVSGTGLITPTF
jgi:HK97 family phage major capsid protein